MPMFFFVSMSGEGFDLKLSQFIPYC